MMPNKNNDVKELLTVANSLVPDTLFQINSLTQLGLQCIDKNDDEYIKKIFEIIGKISLTIRDIVLCEQNITNKNRKRKDV